MIRHEMCLMKHGHKRGDNMINRKMIDFSYSITKKEYEKMISELLYTSFKYQNEKKVRDQPKVNQKHTNKMVSQKYQNVSMKRSVKKTALYCGKVKF